MNEEEIKKKIDFAVQLNSELPELEFKKGLPNDIWRSISAMGHRKGGGLVVFGIHQHSSLPQPEVVGCDNVDFLQQKLSEHFNDKMNHVLRPTYHIVEYEPKKIIVAVHVPECPSEYKPYYFMPVGLPKGAYIREGNTNRPLTDNEFRTYVALSRQFQFDLSEAPSAKLADLSKEKIELLLKKREGDIGRGASIKINNDLLKNLGIIGNFGGSTKPTIAGYLIFSKSIPLQKYPYERYIIRCVNYAGNDSSSRIISRIDIGDALDQQIEVAYEFILRSIKMTSQIKGTKRYDQYEYPEKAIRELVANAVIHRDYKITETFTQISVYKDRLEITNPGNLAPGITIDNIKDAQFSRNAIIAGRLRDLNYLEEYGRGINIVFDKMEEWNLPTPLFKNSVNSFQAVLLGKKFANLNARQIKIIEYLLLKGQITIKDCLKIFKGVKRVTINSDLRELKELEIIKSKGASVGTYYVITI